MKQKDKIRMAKQGVALAVQATATWPDLRLLSGIAYESLVASYGVSHDTAQSIIKQEMSKRRLTNGQGS